MLRCSVYFLLNYVHECLCEGKCGECGSLSDLLEVALQAVWELPDMDAGSQAQGQRIYFNC